MNLTEQLITIAMAILGTQLTRYLPFLVFSSDKPTPPYIQYLGKALPSAVFAMLVVYCLKDIPLTGPTHALPELASVAITVLFHLWKRNMFLSMAVGTAVYMGVIRLV